MPFVNNYIAYYCMICAEGTEWSARPSLPAGGNRGSVEMRPETTITVKWVCTVSPPLAPLPRSRIATTQQLADAVRHARDQDS